MRMFGSIHIPGLGRLSPRIGILSDRVRIRDRASSSPWFWVGFLGMLAVILWIAFTWTALHK